MRISVLIATHNRAQVVGEAIDSVLAQTRSADEIIVIDDGSTDDTPIRLAKYGDRITAVRQQNAGIAGARNTALRHASGDWITFLDDDDIWCLRRLEILERDLRAAARDSSGPCRKSPATSAKVYEFDQMDMYKLKVPYDRAEANRRYFQTRREGVSVKQHCLPPRSRT